ncbi:Aminopeptidase Y (Arg, Lys, Leu preference) [Alloactinosynnema sp. L-07]|uniref:S8 family peptidase n=1 Tax=Alloactinosynnema sp. L-07 TaxID=1653480 RepID=UPI00065EF00C|nr:S8 family serine peptidase [Alloactinosynnema sp. L-07]CRK61385.1 Aminopeptidase Y (Arg, Lys, Leu preference) [Alloactinosynnema sp. L-07]
MFLRSKSRLRRSAAAAAIACGLVVTPAGLALASPATATVPGATASGAAIPTGTRAYFVITDPANIQAGKTAVTTNGGTVWNSWDAIGVIVAHSTAADFKSKVRGVSGVQYVGATRTTDVPTNADNPPIPSNSAGQNLGTEAVGWDIKQLKADQAWAKANGSGVTVAILDTGVNDQHKDLAPNFDASKSASCAYGKVDKRTGAWRSVGSSGHGTHVAGSVAAAKDNGGIVGVAPGAKISSIRVAEPAAELFFPENTVCAFMYAVEVGVDVTNNSYWTDPWYGLCANENDGDLKAIEVGVRRAVNYASNQGLINLVAAGNENKDYSAKGSSSLSPNDSTPKNRNVNTGCPLMPQEAEGSTVVGGIDQQGSRYNQSNWDTNGTLDVTAAGVNVNSTSVSGGYQQMTGTSMASPHAAGIAALIKSAFPSLKGKDIEKKMKECSGTYTDPKYYGAGLPDATKCVEGAPSGGTSWTNDNDVQITDNNVAVTSSVSANGTVTPSATSKVTVNIVHTYRGDLVIELVAPDGTVYPLKAAKANDAAANVNETYTVNLSPETSSGEYKLRVRDAYSFDSGYINSWNLNIA